MWTPDGRRSHPDLHALPRRPGAGVKGGTTHGATDDLGLHAVEGRVSVPDWHATILHLLGLDHLRLTYRHNGRDERLTENAGEVIRRVLA